MGGPMIGMMMKNKITTILTIARLSRRNRRSESCKGVGAFWAVVVVSVVSPSARTSASGIVSAATGWLAVARNSASSDVIVVSGTITSGLVSFVSIALFAPY